MTYLWSEVLGKNASPGVFIVPTAPHTQTVSCHSCFHPLSNLSEHKEVHICGLVKQEMLQTLGFLAFPPPHHHSQRWVARDSPPSTHLSGEEPIREAQKGLLAMGLSPLPLFPEALRPWISHWELGSIISCPFVGALGLSSHRRGSRLTSLFQVFKKCWL